MVQVGCTINYGRSALWKARKKSSALTICVRSARILEVVRNGQLVVVSSTVGLWRSWERASMAWKRSPVRSRPGRDVFQIRKESKLGTDGVDRLLHALRNLLHVNVSCRCDAGVPEHALDVLYCPLLLRQRRNRAPDHLEGQLGQLKFLRQSAQNPIPVVVAVHEPAFFVREDECIRRRVGASLLPEPQIVGQFFRNMHGSQALSSLTPRSDFAFLYGFHEPHGAFGVAETLPAKREQFAGTECIRHVKFQENAVSHI